MPISDELLLQIPITHDDNTRALNELVRERVLLNRRRDEEARLAAAQQKLAEILTEEAAKNTATDLPEPVEVITPVRKGKKEK